MNEIWSGIVVAGLGVIGAIGVAVVNAWGKRLGREEEQVAKPTPPPILSFNPFVCDASELKLLIRDLNEGLHSRIDRLHTRLTDIENTVQRRNSHYTEGGNNGYEQRTRRNHNERRLTDDSDN